MQKLEQSVIDSFDTGSCLNNEFVSLPANGEVGFEEYFELKSEMVYERKCLFSPREYNKLILRYPGPDANDQIFSLFFESPNVVAHNNAFEGCFAIDITEYKKNADSEAFKLLMSFVLDHPETVFLFFMHSDKGEECERMHNCLTAYTDVTYRRISLPQAEKLARYMSNGIRDFALHIENGVQEVLVNYFADRPSGYDVADFYVRYLKGKGYQGDVASLSSLMEKAAKAYRAESRSFAIGFTKELQ